jgi:DNA-binding NtrC family response regulator
LFYPSVLFDILIAFLLGGKMSFFDQLKNIKILLIDDDEWIRDSLSLFLESEGCQLLALETAEEALEVLKQQTYEIIITDYRLPGIDGLEFIRRIQSKNLDAVIILITAYGDDEVISEAKRIGVQDIIAKPFNSEDIEASLSRLI